MPKRTRRKHKQETDDFNIESEIREIKNPKQKLFEITGVQKKREEKEELKKAQQVQAPKKIKNYKEFKFETKDIDVMKQHFLKEQFLKFQGKRKLKVGH